MSKEFKTYRNRKTGEVVKISKLTRHYRFKPETTIEISYSIWNKKEKCWDYLPEENFNEFEEITND